MRTNNDPEQIRGKLYQEYEDSLFRLVIHDAAEKEGKLLLEEKEMLEKKLRVFPLRGGFTKI